MNALNIEKAIIFDISMGGMITQEIILNYPGTVKKLILCYTNCRGLKAVPPTNDVFNLMMNFPRKDHDYEKAKKAVSLMFTEEFIKNDSKCINEKLEEITKTKTLADNYTN
ncbi:MAG: alpha/beta fold hydrolase [Candidatus Thorarchaeota archaeon]